jgi:hypothetical protein
MASYYTMNCLKCKGKIEENWNICPICGFPAHPTFLDKAKVEGKLTCWHCGKKLDLKKYELSTARYCTNCRADLNVSDSLIKALKKLNVKTPELLTAMMKK